MAGGLSEVVEKEAFCLGGCSKALGGDKHSVPKHWFVELEVEAIRVLARPQGPSARSQGALCSLPESASGGSASA